MSSRPGRLDDALLAKGVDHLAAIDPDLARIRQRFGLPPMWRREPGFGTLALMILEQQVSLESAQAAFGRLVAAAGAAEPEAVAGLGEEGLRRAGLTRQKARYLAALAERISSGGLDLDALDSLDDAEVRARLMRLPGIGSWTADCYLLFALRRPDAWPSGDLALATAIQELGDPPDGQTIDQLADRWRPWRAVAARLLWHAYLSARGRGSGVDGATSGRDGNLGSDGAQRRRDGRGIRIAGIGKPGVEHDG